MPVYATSSCAQEALDILVLNFDRSLTRVGCTAQVEAKKAGEQFSSWRGASLGPQHHAFGWRDAMDIIVKWRQLSEPNDQVRVMKSGLLAIALFHFHF